LDHKRSSRVSGLIQSELGHIITQELKDPLVKMASITKVRLNDDLKYADVYVSVLGDEKARDNAIRGLTRFVRNDH